MSANVGSSSAVLSPLRHSVRSSAIDTAQASTTSCNRNFQPSNQVEQRPARNVSKVDAGRSMGSPVKSAVSPALSEYPRSSIDRSNTKSVTNTYEDLLRSVDSILSQSSKISRGPPSSSMPNSAQLQMGSQSNIHLMGNNSHYNSQTADFISTNNSNSFTGVGRGSTQNPSDLTNLSQRQLSNNLTSTTGYDRGNYDHTVNKISIGTNRYDNRNSNTRLVGSCATHGVLDCLLCSLKRGNADRPTVIVEPLSFGGGNNTLIAQSSQNANISNLDARYGSYSNGILDDTNSLVSPSIGNFNMAGSIDTPYANRYYGNLVNGLAANGSVSSIDSQHSAYYMGDTTNVQSHSSQLDSLSIEKERGRKKNNEDSAGLSTTMTYSQRRYPPLPSGNQTLSAHSLNDSKEYFSIGNNHNNKLDQSFKGQKEHDSSFQHDTTFGNSVGEDPTAIVKRPNQYSNSDGIHLTDHAANGDGDYDHNEAGVDEQQGEFDGRAPQKKKTKGKKKILSRSSSRSKGRGKGPHVAGAGASAVQALHNSRHHNFHQNDEADSVLSYVSGNHRRDQGDEALEQPIYPRSSSSPLPLNHRSIPISKFNKPYYEQPHLHDRVAHVDDEEELEETAAGHAALGVGARKVKKKKKAEKRSAPANVYDPQGKAGPLPVLRKNK